MNFRTCLKSNKYILMEGALGERLKREYGLSFDENIAMANLIYTQDGASALSNLWNEYIDIARKYHLPFIATTPTRRANYERILKSNKTEQVIFANVSFLRSIQRNSGIEMYIGGLMGCKGDAYTGEGCLSESDAFAFHRWTTEQFKKANVDFLYAGIMQTLPEAAGLAKAIDDTEIPYISLAFIYDVCRTVCCASVCKAGGYRAFESQHYRYEAILAVLSDRMGGYVLLILFYRIGTTGTIFAYLILRNIGISHRYAVPADTDIETQWCLA